MNYNAVVRRAVRCAGLAYNSRTDLIGSLLLRVTSLYLPVRKLDMPAEYLHWLLPLGWHQESEVPYTFFL
jgi:hypothetical protein